MLIRPTGNDRSDFLHSLGRFLPHAPQHHGVLPQGSAERQKPTRRRHSCFSARMSGLKARTRAQILPELYVGKPYGFVKTTSSSPRPDLFLSAGLLTPFGIMLARPAFRPRTFEYFNNARIALAGCIVQYGDALGLHQVNVCALCNEEF